MESNSQVFDTKSAEQTERLAFLLGSQLKGDEVIELIGDVGAGKTTFTRGFVKGVGSNDRVTSPTFTVSNVYESSNLVVHHYDFYRLDDVEIMKSELEEVLQDSRNVVILEWAGTVHSVLPEGHITIVLQATGDSDRSLTLTLPHKLDYIEVTQ